LPWEKVSDENDKISGNDAVNANEKKEQKPYVSPNEDK
jgi:hypothetical protein